ncbi:hypothetical protein [Paenimyroides viscosum]|uniref:Uncharacterized protein n=1 Tax=Paenimyroides viscosum TaxID=2488729 RepID=A0A3P1B7U6_9FLAO|nr:hypothetical protein [Paenimyroides viscosum]RRA97094.1 hypothetical protein EG242_00785 [Paenimyroides viscosum]
MKRIYLYLFIFSLIINVFLIVNDTKVLEAKDQHIELLEKKLKRTEDSLATIKKRIELTQS